MTNEHKPMQGNHLDDHLIDEDMYYLSVNDGGAQFIDIRTDMERYIDDAQRTKSLNWYVDDITEDELAAILGMASNAAEYVDRTKKAIFYGKPVSFQDLPPMVGDHGFHTKGGEISFDEIELDIIHSVLGIFSEAGEMVDAVLTAVLTGKPIDSINLAEEVGDNLWYLALMMKNMGWTFEGKAKENIEKLKARFPDKFDENRAINRDTDAERAVLESYK